MRCVLLAAIGLVLAQAALSAESAGPRRPRPAQATSCGTLPATQDRVEAVTARGEIRLGSGRIVKLAGIRVAAGPDGGLEAEARASLERLRGRPVEVAPVGTGEPDRWGRVAATVTASEGEEPFDLAGTLVAAGLAVADAGDRDVLCRPGLLALEDQARRAEKGAWAAGGWARPVKADDVARLNAAVGRFTVVEGRLRSVGERRQRTYLDFGPIGGKAATITIPKRAWLRMIDRGLKSSTLRGRTVRARGVVESWRGGPVIEIVAPEMIELVDTSEAREP